jgi:hypothetical protein
MMVIELIKYSVMYNQPHRSVNGPLVIPLTHVRGLFKAKFVTTRILLFLQRLNDWKKSKMSKSLVKTKLE